MKNLGIQSRVILLGTMPAVFFAIILAGYAVSKVFVNLNQSLYDRGRIIATQLAPAAEYGVISGNKDSLQKLALKVLTNELDVRTVMIADEFGEVLAFSGRPLAQTLIDGIKNNSVKELVWSGGVILAAPIYRSLVEIDDFPSDSSNQQDIDSEDAQLIIGQVYVELSNLELYSLKQDLIIKMIVIGLLGFLFSGLIAWMIGRNITKPIQEIAKAVDKVSEGAFSHSIQEDSSGELRVLQKGFNSMSLSIKNS